MGRSTGDYLKQRVLDAAANDYENYSTIAADVKTWAAADKRQFSAAELDRAIESLVDESRLAVYEYSQESRKFVPATYTRQGLDTFWFLAK